MSNGCYYKKGKQQQQKVERQMMIIIVGLTRYLIDCSRESPAESSWMLLTVRLAWLNLSLSHSNRYILYSKWRLLARTALPRVDCRRNYTQDLTRIVFFSFFLFSVWCVMCLRFCGVYNLSKKLYRTFCWSLYNNIVCNEVVVVAVEMSRKIKKKENLLSFSRRAVICPRLERRRRTAAPK